MSNWHQNRSQNLSKMNPGCLTGAPWGPTGSQKAPQTMIPSTYLRSTRIGSISLTPFWSIFEGIYFRIRFGLAFVSILGSEMGPKCNKIECKSILFLLRCCEWFFGVSSWRSRSFLEWPLLFRPSIFIGKTQCFWTFPCLAKHRFANKVASFVHLPSDQQNDKKTFKSQQNAP